MKLSPDEISERLATLSGWQSIDDHHLVARYEFSDFVQALAFTNAIGQMAEEQQHHPDILLGWGKVEVTLWTHSVDGLTDNDFRLATAIAAASQ